MKRPIITLLTDFGTVDHYVAAMKGVILGICPEAEIIDITHHITAYSIPEAGYTLAQAWHYFPKGTTHVAVVDPGVGTARRAILAEVAGHRFVAPDNGLLSMILRAHPEAKIREITANRFFRKPLSNTFHGRDVFAPVAAHLAGGTDAKKVGVGITDAVVGSFAVPKMVRRGIWKGEVLKIDNFGNVISNLEWKAFQNIATQPFELRIGRHTVRRFQSTYTGISRRQLFALRGSSGYIEVSFTQQNAAKFMGAAPGAAVELSLTTPLRKDQVVKRIE